MRRLVAACVVSGLSRFQFASLAIETPKLDEPDPLEPILQSSAENSEAILHASAEVNGGCFFKIFRGAGNFADTESKMYALRQHLVVEHEVVGILQQGKAVRTLRLKAR